MVVSMEEPEISNGPGRAEQASLIGQHRVRLLAFATGLLLVGWQAPGSGLGGAGQQGRVLMYHSLEDSTGSSMGSGRQLGRLLQGNPLEGSTHNVLDATGRVLLGADYNLQQEVGEQTGERIPGPEEHRRLEGHHWQPKWLRWRFLPPYSCSVMAYCMHACADHVMPLASRPL